MGTCWGIRPRFGADATAAFLQRNDLKYIIRSHEVAMQGYELHHSNRLVTVFSAPFYTKRIQNMGAVIRYDQPDSNKPVAVQFPPYLWYQEPAQQEQQQQSKKRSFLKMPFDQANFTPFKRIDLPLIPQCMKIP